MEIEKQYCRKCQANRPLDNFEEGFKTCTKCRVKQRNRYYRKRDYYIDMKKNYRDNHKEEISEKAKNIFKKSKALLSPVLFAITKSKNTREVSMKKVTHTNATYRKPRMKKQT